MFDGCLSRMPPAVKITKAGSLSPLSLCSGPLEEHLLSVTEGAVEKGEEEEEAE